MIHNSKINIILIGMRGSGKSTIGKLLAKQLNREYIEMDRILEKQAGKPIEDIVKQSGWQVFRDRESELAKEVAKKENAVIATGGGVILRKENVDALKRGGILIWLTASIDTLIKRIGIDPNRPLLTGAPTFREDMETTLKERDALYKNAAHYIISTENKTIEECLVKIADLNKLV